MKLKLMPLLAGIVTLTVLAAPLTAQACNRGNKDNNTQESNTSIPIQSSTTINESSLAS